MYDTLTNVITKRRKTKFVLILGPKYKFFRLNTKKLFGNNHWDEQSKLHYFS